MLNATGAMRRIIESVDQSPEVDGEAVIGLVAETTLLVADDLGLGYCFADE